MKLKDMVIGILFFSLVMLCLQSQMLFAVNDPTNRATFAPWTNGGKTEDVSSNVIGPVINGTTWKFTKTGPNPQWNGWEAT